MRLTLHCFHRKHIVFASAFGSTRTEDDARSRERGANARFPLPPGRAKPRKEPKQAESLADKHALGRHSPAEIHHLRSLARAAV